MSDDLADDLFSKQDDSESFDELFSRHIEIYFAVYKEEHESFVKEQKELEEQIRDLYAKIYTLKQQKSEISEKYGFPCILDDCHTWLPTKFVDTFGSVINNTCKITKERLLNKLIDQFEMNYNLTNWQYIDEKFEAGEAGWEPSASC